MIFVWLSLCVTSLVIFSYSSVSSAGEVNFNYLFWALFARLGSSNSSRGLSWSQISHQAQGFLVCLLSCCFHPGQAFLAFGFLSNNPHLSSWHLLGLSIGFYWIMSDYYSSFCSWVTLWLLLGQGFAVASLFYFYGQFFPGFFSFQSWRSAQQQLLCCPCVLWWVIRISISAVSVCLVCDPGIPLCLPKPNTKVQIESSDKTMLFILFQCCRNFSIYQKNNSWKEERDKCRNLDCVLT